MMFNWHKKESPLLGSLGLGGGVGSKIFVGGGYQYWIATLGGASNDDGNDIALDSSGNIFIVSRTQSDGVANYSGYIAKYDNLGNLQWQRVLGGAGNDVFNGVVVDSSDNVYACGYTSSEGQGSNDTLVVKYNNSGVLQWQKRSGVSGNDILRSIDVDSSGNLWSAGQVVSGNGSNSIGYFVYNSSGTLTYSRDFNLSNKNEYGNGIATSGTDAYVVGYYDAGANGFDFWLGKFNSFANIVWQRYLSTSYGDQPANHGVTVDGSGNVYVAVNFTDGVYPDTTVAKYNSSGTLQWQRKLTQYAHIPPTSITTDSDNNVYVTCNGNGVGVAGNYDLYIAKWDTSGTIQWQRALGGTGTDYSNGIKVIDGIMYIVGTTTSAGEGGNDIVIAKLPADGSLTGTYGSFTYQEVTTVTEAAGTMSSGTASLASNSYSPTTATSTLTDSASTLTSTLTTIS